MAIVTYLVDNEFRPNEELNWFGLDTAKEYLKVDYSEFVVSEKDLMAKKINY